MSINRFSVLSPAPWRVEYGEVVNNSGTVEILKPNDIVALRNSYDKLKSALQGLMELHDPDGKFCPNHWKPILLRAKKALDSAP